MPDQTYTLLSLEEAQAAFDSLNLAIIEHTKWLVHWNKFIICDVSLTAEDMSECSVENCGFNQWLHSTDADFLHDLEIDTQVEHLHNQVHQCVNEIMNNVAQGLSITQQQFDIYINEETELTKYLINLRDEIYRVIFSYDFLTSTLTRQAIFHVLSIEHARVNRNAEQSCIVLIDLDHFKKVNDKYGHPAGDKILMAVADFFSKNLRSYDSIGRYGGEEFILCLPDITLRNAGVTMDRLRHKLSQLEIYTDDGTCLSLTVSMGIAPMSQGVSVKTIIKHADQALYKAKNWGRNRVELWKKGKRYSEIKNKDTHSHDVMKTTA